MIKCPYCQSGEGQIKAGLNKSGSQRYRCKACEQRYTPSPKQHGYNSEIRQSAIQNYVDGMNLRRIGRLLGVDHHTVINWVKAYTNSLPDHPPLDSKPPDVCELDELYSFIGDKKTGSTS
jgi:insertion element IS1 protein InsB